MPPVTSEPGARLARFQSFLAQDPGNPALLLDAGELAIASGALHTAVNYFQQAAALQADESRVAGGLGLGSKGPGSIFVVAYLDATPLPHPSTRPTAAHRAARAQPGS